MSAARETASAARTNAMTQDGVRGFELWDRAARLQIELEQVWSALENDSAWAEYVSLRRGAAPDLQGMRECLRDVKIRAALLSYYVDDSTTWLFVLGPDAPQPGTKGLGSFVFHEEVRSAEGSRLLTGSQYQFHKLEIEKARAPMGQFANRSSQEYYWG